MKKNVLFSTIMTALSMMSHAQVFEWAKSFGGTDDDLAYSIDVDASGNVYTTGYFEGTVDFDPGAGTYNLTSAGGYDVFVQKMDASGNFLWARSFGGSNDDQAYSIQVDASGNVYTAGDFYHTVDFDPGGGTYNLTSAGGSDAFVQKMDASGNFLWARFFGGTSDDDEARSIQVDATGNVYTTGRFRGTADFDPGAGTYNLTSAGSSDVFVQKIDASGNFLWARSFGGTSDDQAFSIQVDASGNVYTAGRFTGTVDFDPSPSTNNLISAGINDAFVQKMDASGNFLWVRSIGGASNEQAFSTQVDASGNVYIAGYFQHTVDFDPGAGTYNLTSAGSDDVFVQKLDASGNFLWARSFGGANNDRAYSTQVDATGNVYIAGRFRGIADFDPGTGTHNLTSTSGSDDVFVQKMDASGNFLWAGSFGGSSLDQAYSIEIDASGNIYTTGYFRSTVDFDPSAGNYNLTSAGTYDVFVQKMSPCETTGTHTVTACDSYVFNGITYTASNNTAKDTLTNVAGCDSIVTLDLTITQPTTGTHIVTACDSYVFNGVTYTASNNTAKDTLTNVAGCDSIITLDLTINTVSDITTTLSGTTITANNTNATYQWLDCKDNNAEISGATNQTYTATASGEYTVELTENSCVDTAMCVVIASTAGVAESSFEGQLRVYPNPTQGEVTLDFGKAHASITVTVYDIHSRLVQTQSFSHTDKVNISLDQPKGVYFVHVASADEKAIVRLIKE